MNKTLRNIVALIILVALSVLALSGCEAKMSEWIFQNTLDYAVEVIYEPDQINFTLQPGEENTVELTSTKSSYRVTITTKRVDDPSIVGNTTSYAILEIGGLFKIYSLDNGKTPVVYQIASNDVLYPNKK